jgi:acyl-CoA thioester hydrolase
MEGFRFSTDVVVRFAETDAQGIAHHAAFVVWCEVARIAYLAEHAGGYKSIQEAGIDALTTAVHIEYRQAAHFDDRLTIWARCGDFRGARFRYDYALERDGILVAQGWTAHATVSRDTMLPTRVPAWLVEAIERAEAA